MTTPDKRHEEKAREIAEKMRDMPQDVEAFLAVGSDFIAAALAACEQEAIAAEREACAQEADHFMGSLWHESANAIAKRIASAIRSRSQEHKEG